MQPKQMRETRSPVLPKLMYSMGPPRDIVAAPKRVVQGHHRGWRRHWGKPGKPGTFWRGSAGKGRRVIRLRAELLCGTFPFPGDESSRDFDSNYRSNPRPQHIISISVQSYMTYR